MTSAATNVIVEADGGSRGNPGLAGYGALLRDADTGQVIAEAYEAIGRATNNVAEYSGLIAGLELYNEHTPEALLEVRMDSKLVIEQMAGRWKVKHPDMRPLAIAAQRLAPFGTIWTWVPRERNKDADRLANLAMDGAADLAPAEPVQGAAVAGIGRAGSPVLGWSDTLGTETRLIFVRHGVTRHTGDKRFSGSGGDDPELLPDGHDQARRAAAALAAGLPVDVLLCSPLTRTRETAGEISAVLGLTPVIDDDFREVAFGKWDGLTLAEVEADWPDVYAKWAASPTVKPPGGESVNEARVRVEAALKRVLAAYQGQTLVIVSHVTPIKLAVRYCLDVPMEAMNKMLLGPASLTTISFYESGASALRHFSVMP